MRNIIEITSLTTKNVVKNAFCVYYICRRLLVEMSRFKSYNYIEYYPSCTDSSILNWSLLNNDGHSKCMDIDKYMVSKQSHISNKVELKRDTPDYNQKYCNTNLIPYDSKNYRFDESSVLDLKFNNKLLPFHITSYNNSSDYHLNLNNFDKRLKNIKNGFISSQVNSNSSRSVFRNPKNLQNFVEIFRQQKDDSSKPEVMEFKASQTLFNPNDLPPGVNILHVIQALAAKIPDNVKNETLNDQESELAEELASRFLIAHINLRHLFRKIWSCT